MVEVEGVTVVAGTPRRVRIRALNVIFTFSLTGKGGLKFTKGSDAQVLDPKNLYVPRPLFNAACQKAAAILKQKTAAPTHQSAAAKERTLF